MLTMSGRPEGIAALRLEVAVASIAAQLRPPDAKDAKQAVKEANRLLDKAAELFSQVDPSLRASCRSCDVPCVVLCRQSAIDRSVTRTIPPTARIAEAGS